MIQMELSRIIIQETTEEQVIVLKEVNGARSFPIVIGVWEALAIQRYINKAQPPRPLTHDLIGNILKSLGFTLDRIEVSDLKDGVFYAKLVLKKDSKLIEVDSRPSDAIALAVQSGASIYAAESVITEITKSHGAQEPEEEPPEGFV